MSSTTVSEQKDGFTINIFYFTLFICSEDSAASIVRAHLRMGRSCTHDRVLMENWVYTESVGHEGAIIPLACQTLCVCVCLSEGVYSMSSLWKDTIYTPFICIIHQTLCVCMWWHHQPDNLWKEVTKCGRRANEERGRIVPIDFNLRLAYKNLKQTQILMIKREGVR